MLQQILDRVVFSLEDVMEINLDFEGQTFRVWLKD